MWRYARVMLKEEKVMSGGGVREIRARLEERGWRWC